MKEGKKTDWSPSRAVLPKVKLAVTVSILDEVKAERTNSKVLYTAQDSVCFFVLFLICSSLCSLVIVTGGHGCNLIYTINSWGKKIKPSQSKMSDYELTHPSSMAVAFCILDWHKHRFLSPFPSLQLDKF